MYRPLLTVRAGLVCAVYCVDGFVRVRVNGVGWAVAAYNVLGWPPVASEVDWIEARLNSVLNA